MSKISRQFTTIQIRKDTLERLQKYRLPFEPNHAFLDRISHQRLRMAKR